jgi:hypothetical protein
MKATQTPLEKTHEAIFGRLQRCVAHLHIWAAFEMQDRRPEHYERAHRYGDFFEWIPDAAIFSFVVRVCSLFDAGKDCITLNSYAEIIELTTPIPNEVRSKIEAASNAVKPLKDVRNAYYAHRLARGTVSDLFKKHDLTCNKLFSIMDQTRDAARALCSLTIQKVPRLDLTPEDGLARLLADLR